ncbi:hypothetical protein DFH06DRAFT_1142898 [Mycena polygramma]|nr:hypothetical protein DFH06DRAFT_1142898 [Mycena polygramma]
MSLMLGSELVFSVLIRSHSLSHSRSSAGKDFDWTNTRNRTDVCYRCGLPGHFAQYCVSVMPDDVRHRVIRYTYILTVKNCACAQKFKCPVQYVKFKTLNVNDVTAK